MLSILATFSILTSVFALTSLVKYSIHWL